jgi:hypothetical protein
MYWPRNTLYSQKKLAQTSPTSGGRSVGIVRSRTKATELCYWGQKSYSFKWEMAMVWSRVRAAA